MNKPELKKLIAAVYDENANEFGEQFNKVLSEKIATKIEAKKQEVLERINESKTLNESLREVEVTFDNGDVIQTNMAAKLTDKEIYHYYKVGKEFNTGNSDKDKMSKVKSVKILK